MHDSKTDQPLITQAGEALFNFAIERDDVKWLTGQFGPKARVKPAAFEYELQILKIIGVGWSIAYHLEGAPKSKAALGELFWQSVNGFAKELSETTALMIGQNIDYFEVLKARLDQYVQAMQHNSGASEAAVVIGPVFAGLCGREDDIFAAMAGSKMFANVMARTRQYLEALRPIDPSH